MGLFNRSNVKKKSQKRKVKIVFAVLSLFVLSVAVYFLLPHVEFFKLNSIDVKGVQKESEVEAVIRESRLQKGAPLFSVNLAEVVFHLKENLSIDHVQVKRKIPGTILIQVTPYEPKLILNLNRWYYVSSTGKIFQELGKTDSKDFPVLTGISRDEIEQNPSEMKESISQAVELLKKYEKTEFNHLLGVSEITYDSLNGFTIFPEKKQMKILFGFTDFDLKLKRLASAMQKLDKIGRSFSAIDLNYDGKVILTM